MKQDPTFKDIFSYPFMVEEFMRWFVGDLHGARELVDALDFGGMTRVQEQSTSGPVTDRRRYANDIAFQLPIRDRIARPDERSWMHLVMMIEPQSTPDYLMALRVRNYADNHHMEVWRGKRFGARDRLAPVLAVVIYTGADRWTPARHVIDLVTPGASDEQPSPVSLANRLFAGDGYLALDTLRLDADDIRYDNAAALLAGLCNPALDRLPRQVAASAGTTQHAGVAGALGDFAAMGATYGRAPDWLEHED